MVEAAMAAIVLAVCIVLMARLMLGPRRRQRFDAAILGFGFGARQRWRALRRAPAARREAAAAARAAIRRARMRGEHEGNVVRPDAFRRPRKPH